MFSPEAQLNRMSQQLNLTDDQKTQIKPILEDQAKQMDALRQDTSMSPQDRHGQMRQIRANTMQKIRPILTADQQKKLDDLEKNAQERPGGRGWNRQPPPPPPQ
jgi:Spy/CpxP family protein refolding chaperone